MLQQPQSGDLEAAMPVTFDASVIPLRLRRFLKRMVGEFMKGDSGLMDGHAVARSRNAEDIALFSDRPSNGRHASCPSEDTHNIVQGDPSGGGALSRPAPRLQDHDVAALKPPPCREGGTLALRTNNGNTKTQAQAEREARELATVLVGMGLDGKLPLSRHEMPKFKKKGKTMAT